MLLFGVALFAKLVKVGYNVNWNLQCIKSACLNVPAYLLFLKFLNTNPVSLMPHCIQHTGLLMHLCRAGSAILLKLPGHLGSLLMDCGEGCWGQMLRCLGPEAAQHQVRGFVRVPIVWYAYRGSLLAFQQALGQLGVSHVHQCLWHQPSNAPTFNLGVY